MRYCENCNALCDEKQCVLCGNANLRDVKPDDFCLLTECEQTLGNTLKDALEQQNIACALVPCGNWLRNYVGLNLENYKVYVPFVHYESAVELFYLYSNEKSSDEVKTELLKNFEKWHIKSASTEKKILKKLKADKNADVFETVKVFVKNAQVIKDVGVMMSFNGKHGILVKSDRFSLWFCAETFEIII